MQLHITLIYLTGFASFVENIGLEAFRPEWKIWEQVVMTQREPAFGTYLYLSASIYCVSHDVNQTSTRW